MRKYPGSDVKNFKKTINIVAKLLNDIDRDFFSSPYSVVPFVSQILGLEAPLLGSGTSAYSISSIIFNLQNKSSLFKEAFNTPFVEKRQIVDEFYDYIAPCLLNEENNYIELLINTKYKKCIETHSARYKFIIRDILKDKFAISQGLIKKFSKGHGDFAHIAHYGYLEDLHREQSFLKHFDKDMALAWAKNSYPIVIEMQLNNLKTNGKSMIGWVIFIPNTTEELLKSESLRKEKLLQCAKLADSLGARIVGMAGLVASFSKGGCYLAKRISNIGFTTGHAYTIGSIAKLVDYILNKINSKLEHNMIAIVGAAGSIGSGITKLLAENGATKFRLVDVETLVSKSKLQSLKSLINKMHNDSDVEICFNLKEIRNADLVIIATNSPKYIVKSKHLKAGTVIIDDSFPKNVPRVILEERKDIILLDGGITQLPFSLDVNVARNVPDLMDVPLVRLVSCKQTYGCFAETLILAASQHRGNYGLGDADCKLAKDIMKKSESIGLSLAPLQSYGIAINELDLQRIRLLREQ